MATPDPFSTFDRALARYRHGVHRLAEPASSDAVAALESHLGRRLPSGLRAFLRRHNGAELYRGMLRVRGTSDIAVAAPQVPVFLFADEPDGVAWAFARNPDGTAAFGTWQNGRLDAMHSSFLGWLDATVEILDARVTRTEDRDALRLEVDGDDAHQLVRAGIRALHRGRPEEARPLLERATRVDPTNVMAWQRLGDAQAASDRVAARHAWLTALHRLRLPLAWPGAPSLEAEAFGILARSFPDPEGWERELERFLEERVHEIRSEQELTLLVAATTALADSLTRRGRRGGARDALERLLERAPLFELGQVPWPAMLQVAALDIDLGRHDEAEARLRRLLAEGPADLHGAALALQGRIAVLREEPWADDILAEAAEAAEDDDTALDTALLRIERAVRLRRIDEARARQREADALVASGAPRVLRARAALLAGDVWRLADDVRAARNQYRKAADILGDRPAWELRGRLEIRFGDLAAERGRDERAAVAYQRAVQLFAEHELPVREAWALVRLASVRPDDRATTLSAARQRFLDADMPTGVAVVDALSGAPGVSVAWHLDRATVHVKDRLDTLRRRHRATRAEAERPERRLGAHRLALSHDDRVVAALADEMARAAKVIQGGRDDAMAPPVLRYVAAVDLLAGHRSWSAAEVLLDHLVEARVSGHALRSLKGAVARSPNAALVDGLLRCVEDPDRHRPDAVAHAAEVLGLRTEQAAADALVRLADPAAKAVPRKAAITALGRIGRRDVVESLLPSLDEPRLAEATALALLLLGDRRGVDFHARALAAQRRDLQGHPGEIVGRYGGPEHILVLYNAAQDEDDEVAAGALHGVGLMGDPRGVEVLLGALDPAHGPRAAAAAEALAVITGHHENPDEPSLARRWNAWWDEHGQDFPYGERFRHGVRHALGHLVDELDDPMPWVRRGAYDELVVATGRRLPFDVDGPWRVQQANVRAWRRWWADHSQDFPAGHWFFDGALIS